MCRSLARGQRELISWPAAHQATHERLCGVDGCRILPFFGPSGGPALRCHNHSIGGDVNVRARAAPRAKVGRAPIVPCPGEASQRRETPGIPAAAATDRVAHVQGKRIHTCVAPECKKRPSFGQGRLAPATRCSKHKIPGDVDVVNPMCRGLDCTRGAIFGGPDTAWTRAFCKRHCLPSHLNLAYLRPLNLTAAALRNSSKQSPPARASVAWTRAATPLKFGHASHSLLNQGAPVGQGVLADQASPVESWWGQDGVLVVPHDESAPNANDGKLFERAVWPPELAAGAAGGGGAVEAATSPDAAGARRGRLLGAWVGARESAAPQSLHRIQDVLGGWEPPPSPGVPALVTACGGDGARGNGGGHVHFSPLPPPALSDHPARLSSWDGTVDAYGWPAGLLPGVCMYVCMYVCTYGMYVCILARALIWCEVSCLEYVYMYVHMVCMHVYMYVHMMCIFA